MNMPALLRVAGKAWEKSSGVQYVSVLKAGYQGSCLSLFLLVCTAFSIVGLCYCVLCYCLWVLCELGLRFFLFLHSFK